jgi:mRNA interferase MazF
MNIQPSRGEIWTVDLDPVRGHEQAGKRPVLILSSDVFNRGPSELVYIVPITKTDRSIPFHILVEPPEGGIKTRSYILCDRVRSVSVERFSGKAWGRVSKETIQRVEDAVRVLLEL